MLTDKELLDHIWKARDAEARARREGDWGKVESSKIELQVYEAEQSRRSKELARKAEALLRQITTEDIIAGCQRRAGKYGPAAVKACVDADIAAAKALEGY